MISTYLTFLINFACRLDVASAYPGRPVHHQLVSGSDSRKYRRRHPFWRTAGFEPDRPARRKERALCRSCAGVSTRSAAPSRPEDLRQHQCVLLHARNNEAERHLVSGKKSIKLQVSGPVAARDFQAVSAFTIGATASAYYQRPIAMLKSRVENSSGFLLIGRRRKSSCMPSTRHADFCRRSFRYSSRT